MKYVITENRMLGLIDKMVKQVLPKFNYRDTLIATYSDGDETFLEYYSPDNRKKTFAKYYVWKKLLELDTDLFFTLEDYFGDEMTAVLDWFNQEFNQDAETVNY
jgi:hypothetical protein